MIFQFAEGQYIIPLFKFNSLTKLRRKIQNNQCLSREIAKKMGEIFGFRAGFIRTSYVVVLQ